MSDTIIINAHRDDPFARIPKTILNDAQLSLRATGLLCYLIGKPQGWKMRVSDVAKHFSDGKRSIRSALRELLRVGYATFERLRFNGAFTEGIWKVSDSPMFSPRTPSAHVGSAHVRNEYGTKKEDSKSDPKKNESNFKSESKESLFGKSGCSPSGFEERQKGVRSKNGKEHPRGPAGTQEPPSSARPPVEPVWKPDSRTKQQQLASLAIPKEYPSQREFEDFVDTELPCVSTHRPDLYLRLCREKWHKWLPKYNRWQPIRDWREFVTALDLAIQEAKLQ